MPETIRFREYSKASSESMSLVPSSRRSSSVFFGFHIAMLIADVSVKSALVENELGNLRPRDALKRQITDRIFTLTTLTAKDRFLYSTPRWIVAVHLAPKFDSTLHDYGSSDRNVQLFLDIVFGRHTFPDRLST